MRPATGCACGERPEGVGDVWTWTAIDAETSRLANRVQLTTDGHGAYLSAVSDVFGREVDYPQLVKVYVGAST